MPGFLICEEKPKMAVLKECVKVPFSLISAFYDILGHLGGIDLEPFLMLFAYA
jgi:hypothetical protein